MVFTEFNEFIKKSKQSKVFNHYGQDLKMYPYFGTIDFFSDSPNLRNSLVFSYMLGN